jgi:hypothetical protein
MLLATRALGLGATLTTLYLQFEKGVESGCGVVVLGRPCRLPLRWRGHLGESRSSMESTLILHGVAKEAEKSGPGYRLVG